MPGFEQTSESDSAEVETLDWTAALEQHEPWLRRVLLNRVGDRDAVDDLIQEVGLAVSRPDLRPADPAKLPAWLYRVAVRQAYLYRRKLGRYRKLVAGVTARTPRSQTVEEEDPLRGLVGRERSAAVQSSMKQLTETDRELLMLKYSENWTYQQLADRLGVTVHTIEHRLLKAKQRLRRILAEAQVEVPQ